jgi:hypothetical protein
MIGSKSRFVERHLDEVDAPAAATAERLFTAETPAFWQRRSRCPTRKRLRAAQSG